MNCRSHLRLLAALLLICCGSAAGAAEGLGVLIVDLYLNHKRMGDTFVLQGAEGEYFIDEGVLRHWQILKPWPDSREFRGDRYFGIHDFPGTTAALDQRTMELHVSMPASLMPLRAVDMRRSAPVALPPDFGAYMDYELNWVSESFVNQQITTGLFRPVVFGPFGNVHANLLYRNQSGNPVTGDGSARNGLKILELTYTLDDPERLRSLRIGDLNTQPGALGRSLRFTGIQLATNFATQPTLITHPLPNFFGQTAVPTALDIYVNGRLTRQEQVQPGSFILEDVPVINGAGQMQVVSTDALGRQQVFTQDFYLSTELLREGLSDYSFNLGALREDYGLENFAYGDVAGSATWRHGLRDDLTIEGHVEGTSGVGMISGAAQYAIRSGGVLSAGLGASNSTAGAGVLWQAGFSKAAGLLSYNVEASGASHRFALVGGAGLLPRLQLVSAGGVNTQRFGSLSAAIVHQSFYDRGDRTIISANHSRSFRNRLSMSTFVSYVAADDDSMNVGIRFSMPFGDDHGVSGGISVHDSDAALDARIQRNMPVGNGYGYHLGASVANNSYVEAGAIANSDFGTYAVDVRRSELGGSFWQLGSFGSIAYLDGMTKFTRQVRDAFAVVNVGGFKGVRVYAENQEVGRTNENGQLFVPGLRPYIKNNLRIEIDDLPLNVSVGKHQTVMAPFFRSGVVVDFDVQLARDVLLRAVLPNGDPVPEGAIAQILDQPGMFPVGLDGRIYLQGIDRDSRVEIRWNGTICELDVPATAGDEVMPRLGDTVCTLKKAQ